MSWIRKVAGGVGWAAAGLLWSAGPALAQQYGRDGDGWWGWGMHPMMGYGMGWLGLIMMFIFWGVIIVGVVALIRWLLQSPRAGMGPGAGTSGSNSRALDILQERYARGEITREEYQSMKDDLSS